MTPANPNDDEKDGSPGIDRRQLLRLTGGGALAAAGIGQAAGVTTQARSATAHEFVFYGCEAVCTDTSGNHVIVHRNGEYSCERIDREADRGPVTWTHDNTFCYAVGQGDGGDGAEADGQGAGGGGTQDGGGNDGQNGGQPPGQVVAVLEENEYRGDEHVGEGCRLCLNPNDCAAQFLPEDPCAIVDRLEECGPCLDGEGADVVHCGECESARSASDIEASQPGGGGGSGNETGQ